MHLNRELEFYGSAISILDICVGCPPNIQSCSKGLGTLRKYPACQTKGGHGIALFFTRNKADAELA